MNLDPALTQALHGFIDASLGKPGLSEELYSEFGHGNWQKLLTGRVKKHLAKMADVAKAKEKGLPTGEEPTHTQNVALTLPGTDGIPFAQMELVGADNVSPELLQSALDEEPTEEEIAEGKRLAKNYIADEGRTPITIGAENRSRKGK